MKTQNLLIGGLAAFLGYKALKAGSIQGGIESALGDMSIGVGGIIKAVTGIGGNKTVSDGLPTVNNQPGAPPVYTPISYPQYVADPIKNGITLSGIAAGQPNWTDPSVVAAHSDTLVYNGATYPVVHESYGNFVHVPGVGNVDPNMLDSLRDWGYV